MSRQLEDLRAFGCDIDGTMERMGDDEEFYMECIQDIIADPYFDSLGTALKAGDVKLAFDAAHTLKGVFANVGLTPLFEQTVRIVEPLRKGQRDGLDAEFDKLMQLKARLEEIVSH
ncbi:MAG: Hpt domain-containing protein [Eubacteriales bacterium]|nr:Hpt domain-containing protein [Eubacteriales bacterium]MDD3882041.1 Hpt domain-containing protein [Eubacteriales bacterium]MDD4512488.1 Hpt domain-containing protein [Eubacteriales bacterium]